MSCLHRHDIVHKSIPLDLDKQLSVFKPKKMQQHRHSERQQMWQRGKLQAHTCQVTISLAQRNGWIQFLYSTLICFPLFSWEKNPPRVAELWQDTCKEILLYAARMHCDTHQHTLFAEERGLIMQCFHFLSYKGNKLLKTGKKAYEGVILLIAFKVFLYRLKTL